MGSTHIPCVVRTQTKLRTINDSVTQRSVWICDHCHPIAVHLQSDDLWFFLLLLSFFVLVVFLLLCLLFLFDCSRHLQIRSRLHKTRRGQEEHLIMIMSLCACGNAERCKRLFQYICIVFVVRKRDSFTPIPNNPLLEWHLFQNIHLGQCLAQRCSFCCHRYIKIGAPKNSATSSFFSVFLCNPQ